MSAGRADERLRAALAAENAALAAAITAEGKRDAFAGMLKAVLGDLQDRGLGPEAAGLYALLYGLVDLQDGHASDWLLPERRPPAGKAPLLARRTLRAKAVGALVALTGLGMRQAQAAKEVAAAIGSGVTAKQVLDWKYRPRKRGGGALDDKAARGAAALVLARARAAADWPEEADAETVQRHTIEATLAAVRIAAGR